MDTRQLTNQLQDQEWGFLIPKTPDLSLRKLDRVVSFKLPKIHHKDEEADDLPDITPELKSQLQTMWSLEDVIDERPVRMLITAVQAHMDAINPYFEVMKDYQRSWFECWKFLVTIAQNLDLTSEEPQNQKYYSVPEELRLQEMHARVNITKDEIDFKAEMEAFTTELDKRMAEITELNKKVEEINKATDVATLRKFDTLKFVPRSATKPAASSSKPGCLAFFLSIFAKRSQTAQPVTPEVPQQDVNQLEELRQKLLAEYNHEIKFKTDSYNEYGDHGPRRGDKYRSEWNAIKAKIIHDQIDFYRGQTKEVMLQCIRLYVLTIRTYYLVYGENPVADEKNVMPGEASRIKMIYDEHDKPVLKAKELFKQMAKGMKSQLSLFYCLQPDRYGFLNYLENYNNIRSEEERDAILAGKATEETLEKLFPGFETPEEAFDVKLSK